MAISYEPLWSFLNKMNISKMEFANRIDISNATLAKMGKNEPVTLTIIEKICTEFNCNIQDIVVHVKEDVSCIPSDLLKIGTIIECQFTSINYSISVRKRVEMAAHCSTPTHTCVIIAKRDNRYLIAPINFSPVPSALFDIHFPTANVNGAVKQGYIKLASLGAIQSKHISKIVGEIPKSHILNSVLPLLYDIIPVLFKYNLISEPIIYNYGIDIEKNN